MHIQSLDGNAFSMRVAGYEFPDEELGPTEDNPADEFCTGRFLIVEVTLCESGRAWCASGPIMNTVELERLIDWLNSIARNSCSKSGVNFVERELEFSIDENHSRLKSHVFRDFLPDWCDGDSLTLEFPISEIDLSTVISELRDQLTQFPGRPPIGNLA